jgi:hypothetical protein
MDACTAGLGHGRIMSDIQIIAGQALFVFALGVVLGKGNVRAAQGEKTEQPSGL